MFRLRFIGMLLVVLVVAQTDAEAARASFTIFEHRSAPRAGETPEGANRAQRHGPEAQSSGASATSFKEMIYAPIVRDAEQRYRLPEGLLQALIWTESRFNPMAVSRAGAAGLAQLMPGTARSLGVKNRHDPAASIDGGARYLREMLDKFGAIHLALAAYNAGPRAVLQAGGIPRNRETPSYVRNVVARWQVTRLSPAMVNAGTTARSSPVTSM
jgi:soluble lytic murein transglycosylase-like protein